jgi:hypothetical protein
LSVASPDEDPLGMDRARLGYVDHGEIGRGGMPPGAPPVATAASALKPDPAGPGGVSTCWPGPAGKHGS